MTGIIHINHLKYLRAHSNPEDVIDLDQLILDVESEGLPRRRSHRSSKARR